MNGSRVEPTFASLERALLRRRLARLDLRLKLEILALGLLVNGFVFWQARVPFDGIARASRSARLTGDDAPLPVEIVLAAILAALALLGGALAAARLLRVLGDRPPGPDWLALPLPGDAIVRHLARESWSYAGWTAAFAPGYLVAAVGMVHPLALIAIAIGFAAASAAAARLGTGVVVAAWSRRRRARRAPALEDRWIERLAEAARAAGRRAGRRPRWTSAPRIVTLAAKDVLLTVRVRAALARALTPLVLAAASALAWTFAGPESEASARALTRFAAFGIALLAAAALADALAGLAGLDPFSILRSLPVGPRHLWTARALWVAAFAGGVAIAHALAARWLAPGALEVHLVWLGVATVAIGLLGVHYGLTLYPRGDAARRFLGLTLAIAMAASLMIPLLGWVVLLAAVIHSARRVPRWHEQEDTA